MKGETTRYTHDPNGKLVSTLNANGILETRSYDAAGHLTDISGQDPKGRPLYSRSYTYDPVGNPLTLVATAPRDHSPSWWGMLWRHRGAELTKWTETYTYDSQDRLAKACMNDSCSRYLAYSYDPVGNRTSLETREGATTYSYDAADELLSTSKHCRRDVTTYAYDLNGNETKAGEKRYSYNLENELIEAKDGPRQISYTYTGDGVMATRATRQETTSYAWDTNSDLPELAVETGSKGQGRFQVKDSRSYTYGEAPLGIVHGRDTLTFHTDAIGSVVELSDDHGQIVDSYRYTPFGESYGPGESDEAPAETSENPMRYAGQYLDSESDLYYMRARQYDPETGRFLETDPVNCDQGGSCGSVYLYVDDRPTVLTDPSGACPVENATPTCMKNWWKNPTPETTPKLVYPFPKGVAKELAGDSKHWVHPTGQLPGYPALDFKAPAGTKVLAVVSGTTWWESGGTDPSVQPNDIHSVYGWTFYLKSDITRITYFYSHLQTRLVKNGPPHNHVEIGKVVGKLVNWHQWGNVDHLHLGATGPDSGVNIWKVYRAPRVNPV